MTNVEKSELWTIAEAETFLKQDLRDLRLYREKQIRGADLEKLDRWHSKSMGALAFLVSAARGEQLPTDEGEL